MDLTEFKWTREPERYEIKQDKIEIVTKPHTDLTASLFRKMKKRRI